MAIINECTKKNLIRDRRGLTSVEYVIVLCLIAIGGYIAWKHVGERVASRANDADSTLAQLSGEAKE